MALSRGFFDCPKKYPDRENAAGCKTVRCLSLSLRRAGTADRNALDEERFLFDVDRNFGKISINCLKGQ